MQEIDCTRPGGCSDPWPTGARLCKTSCYHKYSTELSARWAAEDADREARGVYLGCPVCKQKVRFSCYHDGDDVSSVELPLPEPVVLETVTLPKEDVVTMLEWAMAMPGYWLRPEIQRLMHAVGITPAHCQAEVQPDAG